MNLFDSLSEHFIIPMEDELVHTAENGYCCGDSTCYCAHDDQSTTLLAATLPFDEPPFDTTNLLN